MISFKDRTLNLKKIYITIDKAYQKRLFFLYTYGGDIFKAIGFTLVKSYRFYISKKNRAVANTDLLQTKALKHQVAIFGYISVQECRFGTKMGGKQPYKKWGS